MTRASKSKTSQGSPQMPLSVYALDNFIAPKLSELQSCDAEPLTEQCNFLSGFILGNLLQVRYPHDKRAILFNFIRRVEQAFYEYEQGRTNLQAYIKEPRSDHIAVYFRALAHFEQCIAVLYQAAMFWKQTTPQKKMFVPNDGSLLDRVRRLYNVSHHMDERIADGDVLTADATTQVWLLNKAIECNDKAAMVTVTFAELRQELMDMREGARVIVEELPKLIQQQMVKDTASSTAAAPTSQPSKETQ